MSRYAADHGMNLRDTVEILQMMDETYFKVHAAAAEKVRAYKERARR